MTAIYFRNILLILYFFTLRQIEAQSTESDTISGIDVLEYSDEVPGQTILVNETSVPQESSDVLPFSSSRTDEVNRLIEIFGQSLLSLETINETRAEIRQYSTKQALSGKKVVGLYFSADWCGPCRKFTPELVTFYQKINKRRGKKDSFEIVWISRCRDVDAFGKYFAHMGGWYALPPEEAMGERGAKLGEKYRVKGIPSLVLLDESGNVITTDARNKIPQDKAGIGFPWRNPILTLYITVLPKSLRLLIKTHIFLAIKRFTQKIEAILKFSRSKQ